MQKPKRSPMKMQRSEYNNASVILHPLDNAILQRLGRYNTPETVTLDYTNYEGKRALRRVMILELFMGQTEHHPKFQWLVKAYDVDKKALRDFALASIHSLQISKEKIIPCTPT